MSESTSMTLARAEELWSAGKRRGALTSLKAAVSNNPEELSVRMALAEMYRQLNCPDQAGRWGIVQAGWATSVEQDRLGRLIAPFGSAREDITELLHLPQGVEHYPDLQKVIDGPVASYVAQHGAAHGTGGLTWSERFVAASAISWVATVILWILAMMVVFAVALFDLGDASVWARVSAALVLLAGAVACLATFLWSVVGRRWIAATVGAIGCAVCAVVAIGLLASL
ncbi:DUF6584 family protein [Mycetocola zhadangensis]|uniref:DUF6584 family protein n=1 Tax=Mycetocola zhadangensis TaxID=1164595 RepID=UPI003A4E0AB7